MQPLPPGNDPPHYPGIGFVNLLSQDARVVRCDPHSASGGDARDVLGDKAVPVENDKQAAVVDAGIAEADDNPVTRAQITRVPGFAHHGVALDQKQFERIAGVPFIIEQRPQFIG